MALNVGWSRRARAGLWPAVLLLFLAACRGQPQSVAAPQTVVVLQTQVVTVERVVTPTPLPSPSPAATAAVPRRLTVCLLQEPPSLNLNLSQLPAVLGVNEALTGGLIDVRGYQYQPVAFTKLPKISDGDAGLNPITVRLGDLVFDLATSQPVTLTQGVKVTLNQPQGPPLQVNFGVVSSTTTVQQWARWTQVKGLTWEDGVAVSSSDALLAYAVARDPATATHLDWPRLTAAFTAVDDQTVQWEGVPGYVSSTYFLNHAGFLPSHAYGQLSPAEMLSDPQVNRHPLGYGPFKLRQWDAGDQIVLVKNPTYWRAAEALPRLDELVIRFIPDSNRIIAELAGGKCDLAPSDAAFAEQFPLLRQLEAQGLLVTRLAPEPEIEQLFFNAHPAPGYTGFAGHARNIHGALLLSDASVRQAIAYCLDRQAIVDQALNGAGIVQATYAPVDSPFYAGDDQVTRYEFDPAKGLALLKQAGWQDTDHDGVLDNGHGQAFSLVYSTRLRTRREPVLRLVQSQLRENCQIDISIEVYGSEYTAPGANTIAMGRRYDLSELAFTTGAEPPCSLYLSSAIPSETNGWNGYNIAGYTNPDFDAACQAALQTDDPDQKAAQHGLAEQLWSADLPAIVLFAPARVALMRPEVQNVLLDSSASDWWNVENFDLARP